MRHGRRNISLRTTLLLGIAAIAGFSALTTLTLVTINALQRRSELAENQIDEATTNVANSLAGLLSPSLEALRNAEHWGRLGQLALDGVTAGASGQFTSEQAAAAQSLNALLIPLIARHEKISSVEIANDRGEGFLLLRAGQEAFVNRIVAPARWGPQALWLEVDAAARPGAPLWRDTGHDPRAQPWYRGVRGVPFGEPYWTEPYPFETNNLPGITGAIRWHSGTTQHMFAIDLFLDRISELAEQSAQAVGPLVGVTVVADDGRNLRALFSGSSAPTAGPLSPRIRDLGAIDAPNVSEAIESARVRRDSRSVRRFTRDGKGWWVEAREFALTQTHRFWIVVTVPEAELFQDYRLVLRSLAIATAVTLLLALGSGYFLARRYSRPLEALAAQARRIRDLRFESPAEVHAPVRELQTLADEQRRSIAMLESFSRYVPVDVVRELVAEGKVAQIGGEVREVTVLFTDIAGFTTIAESMSPDAFAAHTADYFGAMIETLQSHGGIVDKIVGDGILALWGVPHGRPDHVRRAVEAGLDCLHRLDDLNRDWVARGRPALPTRIGIATGEAIVGNIGAPSRLAYTAIGDTVNLASRLEGLNKVYGTTLVVDAAVKRACEAGFEWRLLDRVVVPGRRQPSEVYEVLGTAGAIPEAAKARITAYEAAWRQYAAADFGGALQTLTECGDMEDPPTRRLWTRCEEFAVRPPAEPWDGTTRLAEK